MSDHSPFPFVVACGRSGTTLLRAILDSHPEMAVPPETHFVVWMAGKIRRYERAGGLNTVGFLDDLERRRGLDELGLTRSEVEEALHKSQAATLADALRAVYALYAARTGKSRYANKTPIHVLGMGAIARLFPESVFVHVIRDGRDVALSYADQSFGPRTLEEAAVRWRRLVRRGRIEGRRLGPDRYLEIRYESLIEDPEETVKTLCDFVALSFEAAMLRYFDRAPEVLSRVPHPEAHPHLAKPPTKGLRDWRGEMSATDLRSFERLAGDLLEELGYERRHPGSRRDPGILLARAALRVRSASRARRDRGKQMIAPTASPPQMPTAAGSEAVSPRAEEQAQ
jgi:hypothetical protein